jgi:hypothetical protein
VQDDVDPAGEPAAGGLARVLPQRLFGQVPTLLSEVEEIDLHTNPISSASPFQARDISR